MSSLNPEVVRQLRERQEQSKLEFGPLSLRAEHIDVGLGWVNVIEDLIVDLLALGWDGQVRQVKEKFGGLRFYIGLGNEEIFARISQAESESYRVCEECGQPGKVRNRRWVLTLCDACAAKDGKEEGVWSENVMSQIAPTSET